MVRPVQRSNGGPPLTVLTSSAPPGTAVFPSPASQPNWATVPSYNSAIMNVDNGSIGIPWNSLLNFISARAAFIDQLNQEVTVLQNQVSTLQSQVADINSKITVIQGQITVLQGQVTVLQGQVTILQGQVTALQGQIAEIQTQIESIQNDLAAETAARIAADALLAPINSPLFTGDPRAPTPPVTDNDNSIATTAFVRNQHPPPVMVGDTGGVTVSFLTDRTVFVNNTTGAPFGFNLDVGAFAGQEVTIKDIAGNAGTLNITVTAIGSANIDGAPSYSLVSDFMSVVLIWTGSNWGVV